jgi:hypothetical protein
MLRKGNKKDRGNIGVGGNGSERFEVIGKAPTGLPPQSIGEKDPR